MPKVTKLKSAKQFEAVENKRLVVRRNKLFAVLKRHAADLTNFDLDKIEVVVIPIIGKLMMDKELR